MLNFATNPSPLSHLETEWGMATTGKVAMAIREEFRTKGLDFKPEQMCGGVGGALAKLRDGMWEPDSNGVQVAILPVYDGEIPSIYNPVDDPYLCDLIAWSPKAPNQWWLRRNDAPAFLGLAAVERSMMWSETLDLFSTPERWLFEGGRGAVVLDWKRAQHNLINLLKVNVDHIELGSRLDHWLHEPVFPLPRITVSREAVTV